MSFQYQDAAFDIKALDEDGTYSGYASLFGKTDDYYDQTMPGCFKKSLRAWRKKGRLPPMLWQHDRHKPIGAYTLMKEDKTGLYVEGKLVLESAQAKEAYALLKVKAISGLSIGFRTSKAVWNKVDSFRELHEIDLWEISLVTFPALAEAGVDDVRQIKSMSGLDNLNNAIAISKARLALANR